MIHTTRRAALKALIPPLKVPLSEWIEGNLVLPDDVSALPGKVRLYPYQTGIADAISDPLIERVTVVKSARIGYTSLLVGALGHHVVNDPAPVLFVLPTEDDAKTFVTRNVEPTFAASPALTRALSGDMVEKNRNTMLSRRFPGGSLKVVAAKAPRNLRGLNIRVLIVDETDAMEVTAEGNPVRLAEMRTQQFDDRKIVVGSTPIYTETSLVLAEYAKSDQRVFEVPCPHCGDHHVIEWKDIRWPEGEPEKAAWWCPSCGTETAESYKAGMVAKGRWRATRPDVKGHAGFRINSLVSPLGNAAWGKLAAEFLAAKDRPDELQTFINLVLGEGWREAGEELDQDALAAGAEPFGLGGAEQQPFPREVLAITAGVDVQRDRIEVTFIGWDEDRTAYVLGHKVLYGLPADAETWADLDDLLKMKWKHPLGGEIGIDAVAVDSSDGETMEAVYRFCRPRTHRKVFAIKGDGGRRPWIERTRNKQAGLLFIVGVDGLKGHIFSRVTRGNTMRFSKDLPPVWFEQLTGERAVMRRVGGQMVRKWEPVPGRRNEALDCTVYAFAVRELLNINWSSRAEQLATGLKVAPPPRAAPSNWIQTGAI
ncbi:phage terminase large subunit family protein [Mesorhizobium sp. PUT5]|uniref:phage terminase large subunit family protein n=1 Tax=Mesorhizobium sp. PUT5 TaxID=3454629 RepID=UPI003FA46176